MKFGKTLYDKITDEWRCYAVDYSSLKEVLKGPQQQPHNAQPDSISPPPQQEEVAGPPVLDAGLALPASTSTSPPPSRCAGESAVPPDLGLPPRPSSPRHRRSRSGSVLRNPSSPASSAAAAAGASAAAQQQKDAAASTTTERISNRSRNVSWDLGSRPQGSGDGLGLDREQVREIQEDHHGHGHGHARGAAAAAAARTVSPNGDGIDVAEFFRIYDCSKDRVRTFYDEKRAWAIAHMARLEGWSEPSNGSSAHGSSAHGTTSGGESSSESSTAHTNSPAEIRRRIDAFDEELDHIIEFLQLNQTAFSKILKKFDKNTGLVTREEKLADLRLTHGFLDGAAFSELKGRVSKLRLKVVGWQNRVESRKKKKIGYKSSSASERVRSAKSAAEDVRKAREERAEALQVDKAERYLRKMEYQSVFFSENIPRQLPHFSNSEIEVGNLLGQGEFANVKEVAKFNVKESCHLCFFHQMGAETPSVQSSSDQHKADVHSVQGSSEVTKEDHEGDPAATTTAVVATPPSSFAVPTMELSDSNVGMPFDDDVSDYDEMEDDHNEEELEGRGFMKDHCLRDESARYAIKRLRNDLTDDLRKEATLDLAIEAKFLATLSHPNIIKQRGTSGVPGHSNFLIVLDRLFDNLTERREIWREEKEKIKKGGSPFSLFSNEKKATLEHLWADRLTAAYDVARAMKYLHENNIVYRDLKPDNIGFDIRGDVKLFDFGLAKELLSRDRVGPDEYRASGLTGSRRYMAPEVVMCKHYGLSADAYSFGILFWEVLALKEPFKDYDVQKHGRLVVQKKQRPKIKRSWPANIKDLMERCWSQIPSQRPTFADIYQMMRQNIPELRAASIELSERTRFLMDRSIVSLYADCQEVEG